MPNIKKSLFSHLNNLIFRNMKKLYMNKNAKKLAAYSAMAGAFVTAASSADAQVTYVDIEDEELEIGDLYELDLNDDGETDFLFQVAATSGGSWSFARVFGSVTTSAYAFGDESNRVVGYSGPFLPYGSAFDEDEPINEDADFLSAYGVAFLASLYAGNTYGPFADEDEKFLGVKFIADDNLHYGWVRCSATVDEVSLTIHDYAFEATPEAEILTGDTGAVEVAIQYIDPAQLSIYSYGKNVNLVMNNLNTENGFVNVYSIDGKVIYTAALADKTMHIALPFAAEGAYTVKVTSDAGVMSKKVFLAD